MIKTFKITVLSLFCAMSVFAEPFSIPEENLFVPQAVGKRVSVNFEEGRFSASVDGKTHSIHSDDITGLPNSLTEEQLRGFLNYGYVSLRQIGDEYGIEGKLRLLGGMKIGPDGKKIHEDGDVATLWFSGITGVVSAIAAPVCYYYGFPQTTSCLLAAISSGCMIKYHTDSETAQYILIRQ